MCAPEPHYTVKQKFQHSVKQTWYGLTLLWCAFMLTLILISIVFDWRIG